MNKEEFNCAFYRFSQQQWTEKRYRFKQSQIGPWESAVDNIVSAGFLPLLQNCAERALLCFHRFDAGSWGIKAFVAEPLFSKRASGKLEEMGYEAHFCSDAALKYLGFGR